MSRMKHDQEAKGPFTFKQTLVNYCDTTGVYTLRQIAEPTRYFIRRLYWVALFIAGCSIFLLQTYNSTMIYLAHKSVASININYNKTIRFPAVTICNQNAFRATKVAELGLYGAVTSLYTKGKLDLNSPAERKLANMTLTELYTKTSHKLSDFLVSCTWNMEDCLQEDFVTELTDSGVCYTFNKARPGELPKYTSSTGALHSLRLHINIEQYEYMAGPNAGAGLRILLHDQEKAVPVYDASQAIPPGSHARVASKIHKIKNLKHPYGKCEGQVQLKYYMQYTKYSCSMDCLEQHLVEACGCRHFYMPSDRGNKTFPPPCTIEQEIGCVTNFMKNADQRLQCFCPISCYYSNVESFISYGSTSNFDMKKTLSGNISALHDRYIKARETNQRVDVPIETTDELQVSALESIVERIDKVYALIDQRLSNTILELQDILNDIDARADFHLKAALGGVRFTTKYNFVRTWEYYSERVLNHVTTDYYPLADSVKSVTNEMANGSNASDTMSILQREIKWTPIQTILSFKLDLVKRAFTYISNVNISYATADQLGWYKVTMDYVYDPTFLALELFTPMLSDQETYVTKLFFYLDQLESYIMNMMTIGKACVSSMICNTTFLDEAVAGYENACGRYNYYIFLMNDQIVSNPLNLITANITHETALRTKMKTDNENVENILTNIRQLTITAKSGFWSNIKALAAEARAYLNNTSMSKTNLAIFAGSKQVTESIENTTSLLRNLYNNGQQFSDGLKTAKKSAISFYVSMAKARTTKKFYTLLNEQIIELIGNHSLRDYYFPLFESLLGHPINVTNYYDLMQILNADFIYFNETIFQKNMSMAFEPLLESSNIDTIVDGEADQFETAVSNLRASLASFLKGNEIGTSFFKENFLKVDVYLRELTYTELRQEIAYSAGNLMGDIGGSAGLFIGASLITMFEIVDLLCHGACLLKRKLMGTDGDQAPGQNKTSSTNEKEPNGNIEPAFSYGLYDKGCNESDPNTIPMSANI